MIFWLHVSFWSCGEHIMEVDMCDKSCLPLDGKVAGRKRSGCRYNTKGHSPRILLLPARPHHVKLQTPCKIVPPARAPCACWRHFICKAL